MNDLEWQVLDPVLVYDALLPLAEIVDRARRESQPTGWIVLARDHPSGRLYYAYRLGELEAYTFNRSERANAPAVDALELHEYIGSPTRPPGDRPGQAPPAGTVWQPSMLRVVGLDATGSPEVVGQIAGWAGPTEPFMDYFRPPRAAAEADAGSTDLPSVDLGPSRGARRPAIRRRGARPRRAAAPPAPTARAVLSAQSEAALPVDQESVVDVRVELADGAAPLARSAGAVIGLEEEIVVILSVDAATLKITGPRLMRLKPPAAGQPSQSAFTVMGLRAGETRVSVMFRQGASDLGTLSWVVTVAAAAAGTAVGATAGATADAAPREPSDDDVLVLIIDEDRDGGRIYYSLTAKSEALGWNYKEFRSDVVKVPRGAGEAALRYVRTIYKRILDRVLINHADLQLFAAELEGIGAEMSRQLLDKEFVREVWTHRAKIGAIQVTTREPYIPWELLRLQHPDTKEIDTRYFGEYGLVRSFSGRSGPRTLRAREWRYLVGTYPYASQDPLGREVEYLTDVLPGRGVTPQPVPPDPLALLGVLAQPAFDVLHIACHGDTDLKDVERTTLILTDRETPRGVVPVTLEPSTVRARARLESRTPIVFLNACETGQQAPSLTDWGGWPRAFWETGAGAFVGTSWSVYDGPASTFARAFYDALLGGATLAEAASAGRAAAKALGDGSWLAYVVYGNPIAKVAG